MPISARNQEREAWLAGPLPSHPAPLLEELFIPLPDSPGQPLACTAWRSLDTGPWLTTGGRHGPAEGFLGKSQLITSEFILSAGSLDHSAGQAVTTPQAGGRHRGSGCAFPWAVCSSALSFGSPSVWWPQGLGGGLGETVVAGTVTLHAPSLLSPSRTEGSILAAG